MTTQVQQPTAAPVVEAVKPAQEKTVKADNRLISTFRLNYDATSNWFNKEVKSENKFAAAAEKTAYVALSALTAVAETLRNLLAGIFNVAVSPINFVASLINSDKVEEKPAQEIPAVEEQQQDQKPALNPTRTTLRKIIDGARYYGSIAASGVAKGASGLASGASYVASGVASKTSSAFAAVKAHPYKTAGIVAGTAAVGAGYVYGPAAYAYLAAKVGATEATVAAATVAAAP